jgi:hypothetical protein
MRNLGQVFSFLLLHPGWPTCVAFKRTLGEDPESLLPLSDRSVIDRHYCGEQVWCISESKGA